MTADQLKSFFQKEGATYEESELATGTKFRCSGGEIFVTYNTGKLVIQGKVTELTKKVRALLAPTAAAATPAVAVAASPAQTSLSSSPIFIVYGHDTNARNDLELLLRQMGLAPVVLQNLPPGGDTIIEKLEAYVGPRGTVGFACVLLLLMMKATRRVPIMMRNPEHVRMLFSSWEWYWRGSVGEMWLFSSRSWSNGQAI